MGILQKVKKTFASSQILHYGPIPHEKVRHSKLRSISRIEIDLLKKTGRIWQANLSVYEDDKTCQKRKKKLNCALRAFSERF
jgi:hypothetical protein